MLNETKRFPAKLARLIQNGGLSNPGTLIKIIFGLFVLLNIFYFLVALYFKAEGFKILLMLFLFPNNYEMILFLCKLQGYAIPTDSIRRSRREKIELVW